MNPPNFDDLIAKGKTLIAAAREYWEAAQKLGGPRAVVWVEAECGHFVLFTRGEYREQILENIRPLADEVPLKEPFIVEEE